MIVEPVFGRAICLAMDERGGGTVWGLVSFVLLVGITGLAVDATDAFRGRTMLQASADAAALAAAIDLPDTDAAAGAALTYAALNMAPADHGQVLDPTDIAFGQWDAADRRFLVGAPGPDAVAVTVRRANVNGNAWATNFLRIIGLGDWDIVALAGAQRFIPDCLMDGLIARGVVDLSSGNTFSGGLCVHGNGGVNMQNHNAFGPDVRVSMPEVPEDLMVPSGDLSKNPGLAGALIEDILDPRMTNHVGEIIEGLLVFDPVVTPDFVDSTKPVIETDEKFDFGGLETGRIYHLKCSPDKTAGIPEGAHLEKVVIASDCKISASSGVTLSDAVLASRGGTGVSKANIAFPADPVLGAPDGCAPGGGVQIFSTASVHFSSKAIYHGVQMVVGGDIDLGSQDRGIHGISAQAGGDITMTSNNAFGACTGGAPQLFTSWYYRLIF